MKIINEENFVKKAETVINILKDKKDKKDKKERKIALVTTSKIRNILAMSADIYNEVNMIPQDKLSEDIRMKIEYLKIRTIYEAGRDESVKALVEEAKLIECIDDIQGSKRNFILFNRYLEALVAYRKFNGGKDE